MRRMLPLLSRRLTASFSAVAAPTGTKIRAAVCTGPKLPFVLEDLFLDDPQPGEVLIRVTACGICHTDLVKRPLFLMQQVHVNVKRVSDCVNRLCVISTSRPQLPLCLATKVRVVFDIFLNSVSVISSYFSCK